MTSPEVQITLIHGTWGRFRFPFPNHTGLKKVLSLGKR